LESPLPYFKDAAMASVNLTVEYVVVKPYTATFAYRKQGNMGCRARRARNMVVIVKLNETLMKKSWNGKCMMKIVPFELVSGCL
jgi:hypothetical protein